jgi:DNA-binding transcriptional ArsR family regulator
MPDGQAQEPEVDIRLARALGHPIRAYALIRFSQHVTSPKEIAEELGEPIGKVSYHVRELRDQGLIELVDTDGSQGAVQHFYRSTQLPIVDIAGMEAQSPSERAVSTSAVLNLMLIDIAAAMRAGTIDSRPERVLSRFHARVDERGWQELGELYDAAMYRSIEIHNESVARLRDAGKAGFSAGVFSLTFETADPEEALLEPR